MGIRFYHLTDVNELFDYNYLLNKNTSVVHIVHTAFATHDIEVRREGRKRTRAKNAIYAEIQGILCMRYIYGGSFFEAIKELPEGAHMCQNCLRILPKSHAEQS